MASLQARPRRDMTEGDLFVFSGLDESWLHQLGFVQHSLSTLAAFTDAIAALDRSQPDTVQKSGPGVQKSTKMRTSPDKTLHTDSSIGFAGVVNKYLTANIDNPDETPPVMETLVNLLTKLTQSSHDNPLTRDGLLNTQLQLMLTEFGFIERLMEIIQTTESLAPIADIDAGKYGEELLLFMKYCFRLLVIMVKNNQDNSKLLFDRIEYLVDYLGFSVKAADVLAEIFKGSTDLIRACSALFIEKIWNLASKQRHSRYLDFLCVLLKSDGVAIKLNQVLIFKVIQADWARGKTIWSQPFVNVWRSSQDGTADSKQEFEFCVAFVRFAALLSASRHRESIDFFLQTEQFNFTYLKVLDNIKNCEMPFTARQAYADIMMSLFIDREPHEESTSAMYTRILPNVELSPSDVPPAKRVDPYSDLIGVERPTAHFSDLKRAIVEAITDRAEHVDGEKGGYHRHEGLKQLSVNCEVDAASTDHNIFVSKLLDICQYMLLCGLYDGAEQLHGRFTGVLLLSSEVRDLVKALVPVLDGRTDKAMPQESLDPYESTRYYLSPENAVVMQLKQAIMRVVSTIFGLYSSTCIDALIKAFYCSSTVRSQTQTVQSLKTRMSSKLSASTKKLNATPKQRPRAMVNPMFEEFGTESLDGSLEMQEEETVIMNNSTSDDDIIQISQQRLAAIQLFPEDAGYEEQLVHSLLDLCRYDMPSLPLASFDTLLRFTAKNHVLVDALQQVTVIGTAIEAKQFFAAMDMVSEFRRLRKWIHIEEQCEECIKVVQHLTNTCSDYSKQTMFRHLNVSQHVVAVLQLRLKSKTFENLLCQVLDFCYFFCIGNTENQRLMAGHIDSVLMPLLHNNVYTDSAAHCLRAILHENEQLVNNLYSQIIMTASLLTKKHGRQVHLLHLLKCLPHACGKPVINAQMLICKIAVQDRKLIDCGGSLEKDEWSPGPSMTRHVMLKEAFQYNPTRHSDDQLRAHKEADYYCQSMQVLSACARGLNPTRELLCASIVPLSDLISRLHEVFCHPDLHHMHCGHDEAGVKNALMEFFREVFVDTNSDNILKTLRKPGNGIWTVNPQIHESFAKPVYLSLLDEFRLLLQYLTTNTVVIDAVQTVVTQGKGPRDFTVVSDTRDYLFAQVIPFFTGYSKVVSLTHVSAEEGRVIVAAYKTISKLTERLIKEGSSTWSTDEKAIMADVLHACAKYDVDTAIPSASAAVKSKWTPPRKDDVHNTGTENTYQVWHSVVNRITAAMKVGSIVGDSTQRQVGFKILTLGKHLWSTVPPDSGGDSEQHVVAFPRWRLRTDGVRPLFIKEPVHYSEYYAKVIMDKLANPYFGTTDDGKQLELILTMLDAARSIPYTISATTESELSDAFDAYLQVEPLDSSQNPDIAVVQTTMIKEGWGILCLRILRSPLTGLHFAALALLKALTGGGAKSMQDEFLDQLQDTNVCSSELLVTTIRKLLRRPEEDKIGFELEALEIVRSLCQHNHKGMQMYLAEQPGHQHSINIVPDIVDFLNRVTGDLSKILSSPQNKAQIATMNIAFLQASQAIRVLISMATGPNYVNQSAIVETHIFDVINRILTQCKYSFDDLKNKHSPKRKLSAQLSWLIVTVLEGNPKESSVYTLLTSLDWSIVHHNLQTLRSVISVGCLHGDEDNVLSIADRNAVWLKRESYKYFVIVQKCTKSPVFDRFDTNNDPRGNNCSIQRILDDSELMEYYDNRMTTAEIVNERDELEILYFLKPEQFLDDAHSAALEKDVVRAMDQALTGQQHDEEIKLRSFIDSMAEIALTLSTHDQFKSDVLLRMKNALDRVLPGNAVLICSLGISIIVVLSYDHSIDNRWSHNVATFGRLKKDGQYALYAYRLFLLLAMIHFVTCILAFYSFIKMRVPVMMKMKGRQVRNEYLRQELQHRRLDQERFMERTVHIFGLEREAATEKVLKKALSKFGLVTVIRVVSVADHNNWALVTFNQSKSIDRINEQQDLLESSTTRTLTVRIGKRQHTLSMRVMTREYAKSAGHLNQVLAEMEFEFLSNKASKLDIGLQMAQSLQTVLNMSFGEYGRLIPVQAAYELRKSTELWKALADIMFSVAGFVNSPLWFTYHLTRVTTVLQGANIVTQSISLNSSRLLTTLILALLGMYVFAMAGLLILPEMHSSNSTDGNIVVENEGGPCASLLTCFISYFYLGFMTEGLQNWLTTPTVPLYAEDVFTKDLGRLIFEVMFIVLTSCIVLAIITGIICDTFGELRVEADKAIKFRTSTCFMTGIPFSKVRPEKSTHHIAYAHLIFYLQKESVEKLPRVMQVIKHQIDRSETRWCPKGRCMSLQRSQGKISDVHAGLASNMSTLTTTVSKLVDQLMDIEISQRNLQQGQLSLTRALQELTPRSKRT